MALRILILLSLSLVFIVSTPMQAHAKKSFWDAMFGWMDPPDNSPDPAQTLEAPFAYKGSEKPDAIGIEQPKKSAIVPLQHAHTNEAAIGKWLIEAVSESMSHQIGGADVYEKNKGYFAPSGLAQFKQFMKDNNIQKVIDSKRFNIRSFVKESPLLLNSGSAENRFRWLYEVPLMVSYMDAEKFNYKEDEPVNQHIALTVQVGRVEQAGNPLGILIETWSGTSQKIDKN